MKLTQRIEILILVLIILLPSAASAWGHPERIISLAPSLTENLYLLESAETLIAVTSYCDYPPQAKTKQIIGTLINPNIEKIYALSPDLVLAVSGINRLQTIEKLKSLGLKVVVFSECNDFDDILNNFIRLAKLIGRQKKAKEIIKEVEKEIDSITKRIKNFPPLKVFWEVGANPLVSIGDKSFANEFISYSGAVNIFAGLSVRYPRVSREEVIRKNPQVIILVTMGDVTNKEMAYWQKFKDLDAAKLHRIYIINADKVCRPTPVSFLTGLKKVVRLLHPEVFSNKWGMFE